MNSLGSVLVVVAFIAVAAVAIICLSVALLSTWVASIGMAREEGREKLALFLMIGGFVFLPISWVFLLRHGRYRKVAWIGKFLVAGVPAAALVIAFGRWMMQLAGFYT